MSYRFATAMRRAAKAARAFHRIGANRVFAQILSRNTLFSLVTAKPEIPAGGRPKSVRKRNAKNAAKNAANRRRPSDGGKPEPAAIPQPLQKAIGPARVPKAFRLPMGDVMDLLRSMTKLPAANHMPGAFTGSNAATPLHVPDGAQFLSRTVSCDAGARGFKLYIPASAPSLPKGLIVMLHGCTQNPDDFAAGTNMNGLAETHGLLIAYPAQTSASNASSCWNWFEPGHQHRNAGEPAILAQLVRSLVEEFGIDKRQVFAAGLSAGAAMAVILGKTYPDLFSAIGVHSGLAYQSAGNVVSALAVMRGRRGRMNPFRREPAQPRLRPVRVIIFQGSADRTVHPRNAEHVLEGSCSGSRPGTETTRTGLSNGRPFRQTVISDAGSRPLAESWLIDGAGHAWSGGNAAGSYTDRKGPDASKEFVRFFLDHHQHPIIETSADE